MALTGLGYRAPLHDWILSKPSGVSCLEITAEHFFDDVSPLAVLRKQFPLYVHGLGLSLGTPGELDAETLRGFKRVVEAAQPEWVSDHIAFTRAGGVDLGHLNPVPISRASLEVIAGHALELADATGRPVLLENIAAPLRLDGDLSEADFLNGLCETANCGLLLDVTNLYINSRVHSYDPLQWLRALDSARIVQVHIVGYEQRDGALIDSHSAAIQPEILALLREVLAYAPVKSVLLERDEQIHVSAMTFEMQKLEGVCASV